MVREGLITVEEARASKKKDRLTRSLGRERNMRVDIFEGIKLADGDKILLCSDGLNQYAPREVVEVLVQNGTAQEITDRMIAYANQRGGSDNISVILIKVRSSPLSETILMRQHSTQELQAIPIWEIIPDLDIDDSTKASVFISYAKEDKVAAHKLYQDLKRLGLNPWLDEESLVVGQNWKFEIRQ